MSRASLFAIRLAERVVDVALNEDAVRAGRRWQRHRDGACVLRARGKHRERILNRHVGRLCARDAHAVNPRDVRRWSAFVACSPRDRDRLPCEAVRRCDCRRHDEIGRNSAPDRDSDWEILEARRGHRIRRTHHDFIEARVAATRRPLQAKRRWISFDFGDCGATRENAAGVEDFECGCLLNFRRKELKRQIQRRLRRDRDCAVRRVVGANGRLILGDRDWTNRKDARFRAVSLAERVVDVANHEHESRCRDVGEYDIQTALVARACSEISGTHSDVADNDVVGTQHRIRRDEHAINPRCASTSVTRIDSGPRDGHARAACC